VAATVRTSSRVLPGGLLVVLVALAPGSAPVAAETPEAQASDLVREAQPESAAPARSAGGAVDGAGGLEWKGPEAPAAGAGGGAPPIEAAPAETVDPSLDHPSEDGRTILALWRRRRAFVGEGDAKGAGEVERELAVVREVLARDNLFSVAAALVREAEERLSAGSASAALARCLLAAELAPDYDIAHFCVARATLAADFLAVREAAAAAGRALSAMWRDVRSRRHAIADEGLTVLFAIVLGGGLLVLLHVGRYASLFLHDFHHLLPRAVVAWQTSLVAVTLVTLPVLLGGGLLGSAAAAAAAVALSLRRSEAIAVAAALVVLAGSRLAIAPIARAGAFGSAAQDVYELERGDASEVAAARVKARIDAGAIDHASAFALGRYEKRLGRYSDALGAYEKALRLRASGELLTNIGNVRFLQGDLVEAETAYRRAIAADGKLQAPRLNLAKICFRQGRLAEGEAIKRDALALSAATGSESPVEDVEDDTRANVHLRDIRLPDAELEAIAVREAEGLDSVSGAGWTVLLGRAGLPAASFAPLLAGLLVVLAQLFQRRVRPSGECDKCGRPVCVRCDPGLVSGSAMCGQCVVANVRRSGVDAPDRIRKEIEARRFRRRRGLVIRAVGLLVGGGGHVLAGRIVGGAVFLLLYALLVSQVLFWKGFLRPPTAIDLASSPLRIAGYGVVFALVHVLSVRHLLRHQEADRWRSRAR
jgi:tetratricopeptide (TPR) repeat protein